MPGDQGSQLPVPAPLAVLVGPAGCGKTTIGRALAQRLGVEFVDADELHSAASIERMRAGHSLTDAERLPWLDRIHDRLASAAAAGNGLVVGCSALKQSYRDRLAGALANVRFVQLDASAATLRQRLAARQDHFFPAALLDSQLDTLEPLPARDRVDAEADPDTVVDAVVALTAKRRTLPPTPWLLLALAIAVRVYGSWITPVPGRDGVTYLWMAERSAAGDFAALFETVFHPFYPLLVGAVLMLTPLDVVGAGQLVAGGCGALAVVPLWYVTRALFHERAALWAGVMYAIGVWFARHPAECMSEGTFYLLAALWAVALLGTRPRPLLAAVLAGLAFLTRPEGFALAVTGAIWLTATGHRRDALLHLGAAILVAALLPAASYATGHGLSVTPKAAFNWSVGAGAADSAFGHYLMQWLRWPGDAWEGLGYLVFPLLAVGAWRHRPRRAADATLCLLLPFLAQVAVVPLLKSHHRFVSGFGVLLLPFAGVLFARLCARGATLWRWWPTVLIGLLVASEAKLFVNRTTDRTIERDLGGWLATSRQPGHTVASDMPRLVYFAGLPPLPPRRITAADLLEFASAPACHFVVLKRGRTGLPAGALERLGYRPMALPAAVANHRYRDEILLFDR